MGIKKDGRVLENINRKSVIVEKIMLVELGECHP